MSQAAAPNRISLFVVDRRTMLVEGIMFAAAATHDISVVGFTDRLRDLEQNVANDADVVVVGGSLPDMTTVDLAVKVRRHAPKSAVLAFGGPPSRSAIAELLQAGCSGFVSRTAGMPELFDAIRRIAAGEVVIVAGRREDQAEGDRPSQLGSLNRREYQILGLLAQGLSTDQIVAELSLSIHTVRNHIHRILTKLHARSRLEAVAIATRLGVVHTTRN
jgi:DNA-binding NarL/FixJ family response regulator